MSFGTTTRSLPNTKIAPALLAVPVQNRQEDLRRLNELCEDHGMDKKVESNKNTTVIGS